MSKNFSVGYGELPGNMQSNVRDEIMKECGWKTPQYFSMKKNGTRALTGDEEAAVELVFEKHGYCAWTGRKLQSTES